MTALACSIGLQLDPSRIVSWTDTRWWHPAHTLVFINRNYSYSGGHDCPQRPCCCLPVCRPGELHDRPEEPCDAAQGLQLPLSRAQARGPGGQCGLYQAGVENTTEPSQNIHSWRKITVQEMQIIVSMSRALPWAALTWGLSMWTCATCASSCPPRWRRARTPPWPTRRPSSPPSRSRPWPSETSHRENQVPKLN